MKIRQHKESEQESPHMLKLLFARIKCGLRFCGGCTLHCLINLKRSICSVLIFIGASAVALTCFGLTQERYALTFDYKPFTFSIEPMSRIETRVREADEEREAERLNELSKRKK